jgi:hypothetical protein
MKNNQNFKSYSNFFLFYYSFIKYCKLELCHVYHLHCTLFRYGKRFFEICKNYVFLKFSNCTYILILIVYWGWLVVSYCWNFLDYQQFYIKKIKVLHKIQIIKHNSSSISNFKPKTKIVLNILWIRNSLTFKLVI